MSDDCVLYGLRRQESILNQDHAIKQTILYVNIVDSGDYFDEMLEAIDVVFNCGSDEVNNIFVEILFRCGRQICGGVYDKLVNGRWYFGDKGQVAVAQDLVVEILIF